MRSWTPLTFALRMMRSRRQAVFFGGFGRLDRAYNDRPQRDGLGVERLGQLVVLVHHAREQGAVERAPVDADAHRPAVFDGGFDHDAEIVVVLLADVDVSRIDAVFRQRSRHVGILLEQQMAVVMEIADDGHPDAELVDGLDDLGHGLRGIVGVDGDAHQLRACIGQRHHLIHRRHDVGRVGIGHRLNHDGVRSADLHVTDGHRH